MRRPQVIGVVMVERGPAFRRHGQKSRRFPLVDAGAHDPGVGGVPRGLGRDLPGSLANRTAVSIEVVTV